MKVTEVQEREFDSLCRWMGWCQVAFEMKRRPRWAVHLEQQWQSADSWGLIPDLCFSSACVCFTCPGGKISQKLLKNKNKNLLFHHAHLVKKEAYLCHLATNFQGRLIHILMFLVLLHIIWLFQSTLLNSGLPRWLSGEESSCQCRRLGFDSQVGQIPWRRK